MARAFDRRDLNDPIPTSTSDDTRLTARVLSAAASALLVSFLVVTRSYAALEVNGRTLTPEATHPVPPASAVTLTDDDADAPMFTVPALAPGATTTNCINVTYDGTRGGVDIRFASRSQGPLASEIHVTIEAGTNGHHGDCTQFTPERTVYVGTLAELGTLRDGVTAFTTSHEVDSRALRFTTTLTASDHQPTGSATADFIWTATEP